MTIESANEFICVRDAAYRGEKPSMTQLQILACDTTLPEEHLAALAELERFRTALEAIRTHQASVGGGMSRYSTTWHIADRALNPDIREQIESDEVGE